MPIGSLGIFAQGSNAFALDSGSVIADFATLLPSALLGLADQLGIASSLQFISSLGESPLLESLV